MFSWEIEKFPTPYRLSENECGHTAVKCVRHFNIQLRPIAFENLEKMGESFTAVEKEPKAEYTVQNCGATGGVAITSRIHSHTARI